VEGNYGNYFCTPRRRHRAETPIEVTVGCRKETER